VFLLRVSAIKTRENGQKEVSFSKPHKYFSELGISHEFVEYNNLIQ
jgi:hypothetical protein